MALVCQKSSVRYLVRPGQGQNKFLMAGWWSVSLLYQLLALVCQKSSVRYQVRPSQGQKKFLVGGGGGLSDYSISSWPWFVKSQVLDTNVRC